MSPQLDDTDERIRSTLRHLPVDDHDAAHVLPAVRAGARSRRNRRRAGVFSAVVVALGLAGLSVVGGTDNKAVRTGSSPDAPTTATPSGYPPMTPLADGPLPVVPRTTLFERDGYLYTIESQPGLLTLGEEFPDGGGAGSGFDPETVSALDLSYGGWSDPDRKFHVLGVTRADVARAEWIVPSGTLQAETFEHPAFPQLRFFFIEDPEQTVSAADRNHELPHVIVYGADGAVLADSKEISEYESAHSDEVDARVAEVDRRRGVEVKDAAIASARVDEGRLTIQMYRCEGDPIANWTEDDDAIRLSATVKRPVAEGPCVAGETNEATIEFKDPVGDRPIIDALTGEVLVPPGSGL
jgi:hypothetical protein